MVRLTDRFITSIIPPQQGCCIHRDDALKGFGVRVSTGGSKTFIVNYSTITGRRRSMSIGRCTVLSTKRARQRAREILAEAALGGDPARERQQLREEPTFEQLAAEYIDRHARGKRSSAEDIHIIHKDILNALGHFRISEIGRRDIIEIVNSIVDRGAPVMANRTLALIRKMFNFGIEQALAISNPCASIRMPGRERRCNRVLSEPEIAALLHNLPRSRISEPVQKILKLILVTAQRPGEVAGAEWTEFHLLSRKQAHPQECSPVTSIWTIPAERSKNGLSHRVPISRPAKRIIESCPGDSRYVFPSPRDRTKHIGVCSLSHAVRKNTGALGVQHFTPHDLRRTAASLMAGMGIPRIVIARILNHSEIGVTAIYDRYGYDREKREALDAWARRLEEIV